MTLFFNRLTDLCIASCLACVLLVASTTHGNAQAMENDTLPIEIKMLHLKLMNQKPDFYEIIYSNPEFQANRHKFGQEVLINQQQMVLQKIYDNAGKDKPIFARKVMKTQGMSFPTRRISFDAIEPTDPILFPVGKDDTYAVFIRNGNVLNALAAPYEFDDFTSLETTNMVQKGLFNVHLVLTPVAADSVPYVMDNGQSVKVILADIAEVKLENNSDKKLLLHKKFNDNNGLPVPVPVAPANKDYMPLPPATP